MKKQYDMETAKKLLSSYAEKVNFYMKENQVLKRELTDIRTNLEINKELLFKQLSLQVSEKDSKILQSLKNENAKITKTNQKLYKEKIDLEKKLYKAQQEIEDLIIKNQEINDREATGNFLTENLIKEKDNLIMQLKKELEKYYREDFNSTKEIIICEPDKVNVEMNNELCETREVLIKYSKILLEDKKLLNEQEEKINNLNIKILNLKRKNKIKNQVEDIQTFNYILTSSSSSEEEEVNSNNGSDNLIPLESPIFKFPEKIKQTKYLCTDISDCNYNHYVPKLDFSKVLSKYQPLKKIDIIEGVKQTNRSSDEYIEKLKFNLKYCRNSLIKYKKKNKELKQMVSMVKHQYIELKNSIRAKEEKNFNKKNYGGFNSNTNHNTTTNTISTPNSNINSNNRGQINSGKDCNNKLNNDSMEANTSVRDVEIEFEGYDDNFDDIIKEYNKNIIEKK